MKVLNFTYLSVLFCCTILFSNCSNSGSKTSAEKADTGSENVAVAEKIDANPEPIVLLDKGSVNPEHIALIEKVLLHFNQDECGKIVSHFDNKVKSQINEGQLTAVWERMNSQIGKYSNSEFLKAEKLPGTGDRVVYECHFGIYKMNFELVIDKDNKIAGIFFKPQ